MRTPTILSIFLAIALLASALLVVQATYEHRSRLAELIHLRSLHDLAEARRMQLMLQKSTLTNHARIARLAKHEFGMHPPRRIRLILVRKP
ncbi:MAG: cell division protein FtsL [Gammaproteobacteria bacterium]